MQINTSNNQNNVKPEMSKWLTWPVIIIATILFMPVGIFLIWKRNNINKGVGMKSSKKTTIGWVIVFFASFGFLGNLSQGNFRDSVFSFLFIIIVTGILISSSKNGNKGEERFSKYLSIITNHQETSIENIAAAIPTTYEAAKKDLKIMIDKGYLPGAYINETSREIVLLREQQLNTNEMGNSNHNTEMVVVNCKGCGANNMVAKGKVEKCQYCDSLITYEN